MNANDLIQERALDQPQTLEFAEIAPESTYLLANQELRAIADRQSDLVGLHWPWADAAYARTIKTRLSAYQGEELTPIVNRYYPGYQETIYGNEGLILSKRLVVPLHSADERALFWSYECQAEGDSVVRMDVEIDWGEALTQRMVDGLLVAQRSPRAEQGIYKQSNAESTRVFGNPHGRPDSVELDDAAGTAHLVYHVLVNGIVDVSLLLTVSDVGEQVAWNAFLALRDTEQVFARSNRAWEDLLKTARLWTPNANINYAAQAGKREAILQLVHLRSGMAPADRNTAHVLPLAAMLDAIDPVQSRNLIEHMRRVAEKSKGFVPTRLSLSPKDELSDPGKALRETANGYIFAVSTHMTHHPDKKWMASQRKAGLLCAEALVKRGMHIEQPKLPSLATLRNPPDGPRGYAEPWGGIHFTVQLIWLHCGVIVAEDNAIEVAPNGSAAPGRKGSWAWWALLDLPLLYDARNSTSKRLSLVWDGATLHTNLRVRTTLPLAVHKSIRALHSDELDFDLTFEFVDGPAGARTQTQFRPTVWE